MVEKQLGKKINHLLECGIFHQLSCPRTQEQNSVAERKHRYVVEFGLAMMHEAFKYQNIFGSKHSLLPTFSRLPSPALRMRCSYTILFKKKPMYSIFRTFGARCYPYLKNYATDKFDPRSLPCIFLGYSDKHRGYQCLHQSTSRVYISRHVVFDENHFPFSPLFNSCDEARIKGELSINLP